MTTHSHNPLTAHITSPLLDCPHFLRSVGRPNVPAEQLPRLQIIRAPHGLAVLQPDERFLLTRGSTSTGGTWDEQTGFRYKDKLTLQMKGDFFAAVLCYAVLKGRGREICGEIASNKIIKSERNESLA